MTDNAPEQFAPRFRNMRLYLMNMTWRDALDIRVHNQWAFSMLSPDDRAAADRALAHEVDIVKQVAERYLDRHDAVHAKNRTPEQEKLMKDYGLMSQTTLAGILTLGFNAVCNDSAEEKALQRDLAEILPKTGYDMAAGRALLRRHNFANPGV